MKVHDVKQGSPEWFSCRSGHITASNFDKLFMGKSTLGYSNLINTVVYERLTGDVPESYESEWMKRGNEIEPQARLAYELETFRKVEIVGFVEMDEYTGCSPDGYVDNDGMVQIKAPKHTTFITYALDPKKVVAEYEIQVQGEMMVTGRLWSDLVVFHPKMQSLIIRVNRNEEIIASIQKELAIAISTAKERLARLKR